MNSEFTDITVVLDRSGSMSSCRRGTVDGFNEFLGVQRRDARGDVRVSLVQFDDEYEPVYSSRPVADAPPLTDETFVPRGATALLDAVGKTVRETGARYAAMDERSRPGKVVFVVITDGYENASREFTRDAVFRMIDEQRTRYSWDFVFLGANQDAIATAAQFGIGAGKAMTFLGSDGGSRAAFASTAAYVVRASAAGSAAAVADNAFTQDERDAQKAGTGGGA